MESINKAKIMASNKEVKMMAVILMMILIFQNKVITPFTKVVLLVDQVAMTAIKFKWELLIKVACIMIDDYYMDI